MIVPEGGSPRSGAGPLGSWGEPPSQPVDASLLALCSCGRELSSVPHYKDTNPIESGSHPYDLFLRSLPL